MPQPIDLTVDVPDYISLPLMPMAKDKCVEQDIYVRFMRHLRLVPNSNFEIKILSSIQFTADMMNLGDDYVTKVLIDCGLDAPSRALPANYLNHVRRTQRRDVLGFVKIDKALINNNINANI